MNKFARQTKVRTTDGLELAVYEGGQHSGPAILFIHGYLFSASAFVPQFTGVLADSCRLVAFDLRGHGDSDKPLERGWYASSRQWADDITSVLDALDVGRTTIVGWSLGSRVALNYAWNCDFERIEALNLVAATLPTSSHDEAAGLPANLSGLLSFDDDERRKTTETFISLCTAPVPMTSEARLRLLEIAMSVPPQVRIGARSWPLPYDDRLDWVSCDTIVTHGESDPVVSLELSRDEATAMPRGSLQVVAGAGHMPFKDQPATFDASLLDLITRIF